VSTGAAAVPARRKSTTAKRAPRAASVEIPVTAELEASPDASPDREEIASLAYSFWVERGYQGGSPEEDWLRAEQQLSALSAK